MKLRFGKSDWIKLQLLPLDSHVEQGVRVFEPTNKTAARAAVVANSVVASTFEKGVRSYATMAERKEVGSAKVQTAVFKDERGSLRVVYREVVIRFEASTPNKTRKALLGKFGLEVRTRNPFQSDQVIAVDPKRKYIAQTMIELANELTESDEVAFAFPNFVSEFKRSLAPAPIKAQWHLDVVDARKAWSTTQGNKVIVAVLDDGIDVDHPNLKKNIVRNPDPSEASDICGRDFFVGEDALDHFNPRPKRFQSPYHLMAGNDIHGTPCAGVVAASGDVNGVRGIAPKARILPVKIFHADTLATESNVANAIRYASRFADVLSCSWSGPQSPDIEYAIEEAGGGRNGKGSPVFVATGNDFSAHVSYPARSRFAIAVGASTDKDVRASYSNYGPEVSVVAPSSGGERGIFTTDVSYPNRGFNTGNAAAGGADGLNTNEFGGTSSATPLAAGIAALIYSVNPSLSRDELRDVLQATADKIGPSGSYNSEGHSKEYGFGRVNAASAVEHALDLAKNATAKTVAKRPTAKRKPRRRKVAATTKRRRKSKSRG